jgi:hypothetical protein
MSTLPRSESGDFPWWGDDQDIVLRDQVATAVYRNRHGGVVVRQQNGEKEQDREPDEHQIRQIEFGREPKDAVAAIPATAEVEIATSSLRKEENRLIGNGSKPKAAERHKHKAERDRKTDLATTSYNGTAAPDENGKEIAGELFVTETAS